MAINTELLIAAPILQDYFVDKDTGEAMSAGILTFYKDNARTTLKNIYYQTGAPGAYTYIPLPNPLTLSNIGTIQDNNRNDVIPFWYPYNEANSTIREPYYVVVQNSNLETQFTRANFPFNPGTTANTGLATNNNLICNNEFWRNIGSVDATTPTNTFTIDGLPFYYVTLAPSQHDGFTMPDINFFKNDVGAEDTITFEKFVDTFLDQVIPDSITPEYYMNIKCTQTGPETLKYIQIPIQLHIDSLSGVTNCTVTIAAMSVTGNPLITLDLYQFLGSGVASPLASTIETFQLSQEWSKYTTLTFSMPSSQNLSLGTGQDDAFYLQVGLPTDSIYEINIALPSFYLSNEVPTNDFQTYDQINSIISTPRTGDVRISMNEFLSFGWVAMNDGTIGYNSNPMASYLPTSRNNQDTWPLYSLLWNKFHAYSSGTTNLLVQLKDSSGANVAYGSTAIGDFNLNKSLTLSQTMGKVLLGTVPIDNLLTGENKAYVSEFTVVNNGGFIEIDLSNVNLNIFNGMPFYVATDGGILPGNLSANTIYYISDYISVNPTRFHVATSFANAMTSTNIAYTNSGTIPNIFTACFNGTSEGEYGHKQLLKELVQHQHTAHVSQADTTTTTNRPYFGFGDNASPGDTATTTGISGFTSQFAMNVTQPGVFFNIYMKL